MLKEDSGLLASLDELLSSVRHRERALIAGWVASEGVKDIERVLDRPMWLKVIWSLCHPIRFARAVAIANIAIGIGAGRYEQPTNPKGALRETLG